MRRLLVIIFMLGAFLGGYQLGRQPGSPDLIGWARKNYPKVAQAGRDIIAAFAHGQTNADPAPVEPGWEQR